MMREEAEQEPKMNKQWGTVGRSMFTLFQITTGDNWSGDVVRPAIEYHPYMVIFFLLYLCITQFAFLNTVVAVIAERSSAQKNWGVGIKYSNLEFQLFFWEIYY